MKRLVNKCKTFGMLDSSPIKHFLANYINIFKYLVPTYKNVTGGLEFMLNLFGKSLLTKRFRTLFIKQWVLFVSHMKMLITKRI